MPSSYVQAVLSAMDPYPGGRPVDQLGRPAPGRHRRRRRPGRLARLLAGVTRAHAPGGGAPAAPPPAPARRAVVPAEPAQVWAGPGVRVAVPR